MYVAVILKSVPNRVEGELIFGSDIEKLKQSVESLIDKGESLSDYDREHFGELDFEWDDNLYYYPVGDTDLIGFQWAKIHPVSEYSAVFFGDDYNYYL